MASKRNRPPSKQKIRIMERMAEDPTKEFCGADFINELKLLSGTVYPILFDLEKKNLVSFRWEDLDPSKAKRPRKRLYKINALGQRYLLEALEARDHGVKWAWLGRVLLIPLQGVEKCGT